MSKNGKNEGVRMLDEMVCEANPGPEQVDGPDETKIYGRGENEGVVVNCELECDNALIPDQNGRNAKTLKQAEEDLG